MMKKDWTGNSASIFKTMGASNHADHERQREDYYATEPAATEWLCKIEKFRGPILEPSCGEGHVSKVLIAHGYDVTSRDLIDRGFGTPDMDFLAIDNISWSGDIITNPPYRYAQDFVEKALRIIPHGNKVAMFLKLSFLEGKARRQLFRNAPPYPGVGVIEPTEVCHEWRLRWHRHKRNGLRLVHLAEKLEGRHRGEVVQLN